jgi:alpha-1,3-rhamnosyl/mannosyltransferase
VRHPEWVRAEWHERRAARIRDVVSRADHVVTPSRFMARELCEEYELPPERVHCVWHGVDRESYRPPHPETVARLRSLHGDYAIGIGLLTPRKNIPTLVRAVARIQKLKLMLVGRDADGAEQVRAAIDACGMRERIIRLPEVSRDDLVALLGAARVCAVPSLYEGFGLTVLEAMACGTPVVCSRAASLPEVAADAALLVDAASEDELGDGIRRVLDDSALADELRSRGAARAGQMTWERAAREMRALYQRVA